MNIERMSLDARAARHAALADRSRLAIVDELALGDRSPSELQAAVDLPSNLAAHHLRVLEAAGIVTRRRSEGDRRRTYLTLTDPSVADMAPGVTDVPRVLFVCSANSARSQLAAAVWAARSTVPVSSAGTRPAAGVAEGARDLAERRSLTLLPQGPQHVDDVARHGDYVIAVCDSAYEELGPRVTVHWSMPDPVPQGDAAAFDWTYAELDRRIAALAPRLVAC